MAAGTVGYTDTRGNKDYTSMIAKSIGNRLKQASNMASEERAYAAGQAEAGGTSLEEAGIGKGYFFGRALGSRFGGDRIARTRGRMGMGGAGTNPAANYKERFRGGFDYNVTNQTITDVAPLSNALVTGLRGVQEGLTDVAGAIQRQGTVLNKLSQNQADMAKATMFNGYLFAMFQSQQKQAQGRASLRREEKSLEGGGFPRGRIGGAGFGGAGGGRGMINITPGGGRSGGMGPNVTGGLGGSLLSFGTSALSRRQGKFGYQAGKALGFGTSAATGIGSGELLKVAGKLADPNLAKKFNPAKVSANLAKLMGDPSSGSMFSKLLSGGDEAVDTAELVAKTAGNLAASPTGVKQLDFMMSMQAAGKGDLADEMLDAAARAEGIKTGRIKDADFDADIFNALRDRKGRKMYSRKQVEIFRELGLSPGVENYNRYVKRIQNAKTLRNLRPTSMRAAGMSEQGIAEAIKKYYPNVKFKNLEEAVVLTEFARQLDLGKKPDDAIKFIRTAFGSEVADNVFIKGAKTAAKNSMVQKALGKAGSKSLMKKIPILGAVLGTAFAVDRLRKGDFLGAGLEFTSGMLGIIPGIGSSLGFGIDGFLLARDLGMTPMAEGGIVKGRRGLGLPMMLGNRLPSVVGEGGSDEAVLPLNKKTFLNFGLGFMEAMKDKKSDYAKITGMGVFSGIGDAASGGLFANIGGGLSNLIDGFKGMFDGIKERFSNFKQSLTNTLGNIKERTGNLINKINPFKKDDKGKNWFQRRGDGIKNWWNKNSPFAKDDEISKKSKKSGIPKSVLDANPDLDPTKPGDYIKLKRMVVPLPTNEANIQSGMYSPVVNAGTDVQPLNNMATTIINNNNYYSTGGDGGTEVQSPTSSDYGLEAIAFGFSQANK